MTDLIAKIVQRNCLWLALLIHLLIFLGISLVLRPIDKPLEFQEEVIPSYAYEEAKTAVQSQETHKETMPTSPWGIKKGSVAQKIKQLDQLVTSRATKNGEPVHLVGEKGVPKPLIVILGKALTAFLAYPKVAHDLNIRGVSVIGFVLHPDGHVTDVQLVKTSTADILDQAALNAARKISPVKNVAPYVSEPQYIVFGIIFGSRK